MNKLYTTRGFGILKIIFWIAIIILVLSYFKINIRDVVESPETQENVQYVTDSSKTVWERYLEEPAGYVWNTIIVGLLWEAFINNLERVRDGKPTEFEEASPGLPA
ncbi:MAG TPA: hypothetical protein VFQ59_02670 [Candidatus Paceibacterota bacterium]|nr:hypothetical protein [Candidatus Paceibacterota bacterium]